MRTRYFYGYNIVAAGFIIQALCIGIFVTYGVFFREFQDTFGWSRATISGAASLGSLITGAASILAGRLNDKTGPQVLIASSGILLGLGYMLMSFVQAPWQLFLLYGLIIGVGFGTVDVITLSTITRWFLKRRGMMSGIIKVGTGFGQLAIPLIVTLLITVYGWRGTYIIIGTVLLITLPMIARVLRRDPQGMGLLPDNGSQNPGNSVTLPADQGVTLRYALGTKQLWLVCAVWFALLFCLMTVLVHIVPHARDLGLPQTTAAAVLSTIGGVSMLGRFCMGSISDRIGSKISFIISTALLLLGLVWLQVAEVAWMLFLFATINGFAHGGLYTILSLIVAELFGTRSHGVLFGIIWFCGHIGAAIGPLVAGWSFDVTGSYRITFLVVTALAALGLVLIALVRPLRDSGR